MNIAVVGGSGFIGSHLVDKLVEHGHEVTVFDIMKPHRGDIRHIYIDIASSARTTVALTGYYDAVYMLAAVANVNDVYGNPVETGEVNIMAIANVLEAARRSNIPRVILASTVWVYEMAEDNGVNGVNEDTPLCIHKVNHIYTASKVAAELYCYSYQKLYQQDFTILRYGIPYGPRGRAGTVITNFVARALRGEPLTVFGDGNQYRNFIYIEDLVEGNIAALKDIARNQTYNLEGSRPVSVREIAEIVKRLVGNVEIEYKEARPGDCNGRIVSADKAKMELGWQPKVDIEEGIRRYTEWYKSHNGPKN